MRQKLKVASLRTIRNRSERIAGLEAELAGERVKYTRCRKEALDALSQLAIARNLITLRDTELTDERARLDNAKRVLCNLLRVNGGSPLDEEAVLAALDAAREAQP